MIIKTSDTQKIRPFLDKLYIPPKNSHKGQNGKVLIIGGSTLFHSSPIWAAEMASHFVDMVHFSSTEENNEIILSLKKDFQNGMVVHQKNIPEYVLEDDAILIGPGMLRNEIQNSKFKIQNFDEIIQIQDEAEFAKAISYFLITKYPHKRFIIDAGALQMIDKEWLRLLDQPAIITPHQLEFERLFGFSIADFTIEERELRVKKIAKEYQCIILLKTINDIISDGDTVFRVVGGNQGLTKGGTGDVLSGLVVALYSKNNPIISAVIASFLQKRSSEVLAKTKGYWYNTSDLLEIIPNVFADLVYNKNTQ